MTGMAVVGVMIASAGWSPAHGGWFDWFHHDYQPKNVFAFPERLSLNLRRVAVLPLVPGKDNGVMTAGCEELGPVLRDELTKVSGLKW